MADMSRRKIIASGASAITMAIAGCSEDDDQSDAEPTSIKPFNGEYEVSEDAYATTGVFTSDGGEIGYNFTVTSGPEVDVYLLTVEDVDRYENGQDFDYLSHTTGSSPDTAVVDSATVESDVGTQMVIDNTNRGDVAPPTDLDDNVATVQLEAAFSFN